ncbi:MAG: RHS repeat-associated core domain-containing protein [bacterium]
MGLTDASKTVVHSYFYDDFGNSLGSWGSVNNHYLYTDQEYDGTITQLYNLRARYYSPGIGRFVSEDPECQAGLNERCLSCNGRRFFTQNNPVPGFISSPQNLNRYPYVINNPLRYVDPTGRQGEQEECCYVIVIDWDEFWQCMKEWHWSTEPVGIGVCGYACIACAHGLEPACVVCALCTGYTLGTVAYCLDVATSLEPVPGPCPPPPSFVLPDISPPRAH